MRNPKRCFLPFAPAPFHVAALYRYHPAAAQDARLAELAPCWLALRAEIFSAGMQF
jgi:hypothetical protein